MTKTSRPILGVSLAAIAAACLSCASSKDAPATPPSPSRQRATPARPAAAPIAQPAMNDPAPRDYPGIRNAVAYHPGFISGGVPEGDAGFDTLAGMGVRTIISVDGAEPDVAKAGARGIRYIHLPIGYNGFDEQRKLELVRAARDAMNDGPVYIHCHHGKHRSAGAAAAIAASLGWQTPQAAVERMKVSGTAPNYTGLYACAASAAVLDPAAIDAVPADFPAVSRPAGFVQAMVEVDHAFEHLRAIEAAGWTAPADHPDLVPAAEAGRLADHLRLLIGGAYAARKPAEFTVMLTASHARAQALEDSLAAGERDASGLSARFELVAASCKDCHAKYRD